MGFMDNICFADVFGLHPSKALVKPIIRELGAPSHMV